MNTRLTFVRLLVRPSYGCPPRGWASILQSRSVTRTDRFQNQMGVTGDTFLGVRFLSAESARVIGLAALPRLHQPPSGFLTLSAVYAHPYLVALFHATSTLRILVFRAFPSAPAVVSLDTRCSLVVTPACWFPRRTGSPSRPLPSFVRLAHLRRGTAPRSRHAPPSCARHRPRPPSDLRRMTDYGERPVQHEGLSRGVLSVRASPPTGKLQRPRASQGVDFRALIRRRVRSWQRVLPRHQVDALLTFSPFEVMPARPWGVRPPLFRFRWGVGRLSAPSALIRRFRVSIQSSLEETPRSLFNPLRVFHLPPPTGPLPSSVIGRVRLPFAWRLRTWRRNASGDAASSAISCEVDGPAPG
jgi:hypothetical protein